MEWVKLAGHFKFSTQIYHDRYYLMDDNFGHIA